MNFIHFKKIDSTNSEALRRIVLCRNSKELRAMNGSVFVAEEQTAGRGRINRNFYSPAKSGIYFSAVYAPEPPLPEPAVLTAAAAVAICRALKTLYGVEPKIKWVNDIYVNEKKISGILTEGHLSGDIIDAAVVGIGINITTSEFPSEIKERAGSIFGECRAARENVAEDLPGGALDGDGKFYESGVLDAAADTRIPLAELVCKNLFGIYEGGAAAQKAAMAEYKARSFLVGKSVRVIPVIGGADSYSATVLAVDDDARLVVRTESGEERALNSGEVSVKI